MKKQIVVAGTVALLALGLLLSGCGGKQAEQQPASASQTKPAQQTAQTPQQTQPATAQTYPIDWCIVSGEKLGAMGEPVVYNYNGRTLKFCCKNCIKIFEKEPAKYIAKLDSAAAGLIKQPTTEEHGSGG